MYYPTTPWHAHAPLSIGQSCTTTLHPGGASGALLKSNFPHTCWYADNFGFIREGLHIFNVITACMIS
jgi:hypothetical protein